MELERLNLILQSEQGREYNDSKCFSHCCGLVEILISCLNGSYYHIRMLGLILLTNMQ
jgi:hypothetical protein